MSSAEKYGSCARYRYSYYRTLTVTYRSRINYFTPHLFNRLLNTFDELWDAECIALNWEDEETFLNKLFLHSQRFRGQGIHYLMFLIAACPSDNEKPGQLPVSEVLMGRSRLGFMDIHNFSNPYVFEV